MWILALGALGLVGASAVRWVLPWVLSSSGSTADEERYSRQELQAEWERWRDRVESFASGSYGELPSGKLGWWESLTLVPPRETAWATLKRRLGRGVELVDVEPVQVARDGEGVRIVYRVRLRVGEPQYLVPIGDAVPDPRSDVREQALIRYVLFARGLPPGKVYFVDKKTLLVEGGKELVFPWVVRRAVKEGGIWKILSADPIPLERGVRWDAIAAQSSRACVIRSASEIDECLNEQETSWRQFRDRVSAIEQTSHQREQELQQQLESGRAQMERQLSEYRQKLLAQVPQVGSAPRPNRELLKSGTGTPTAAGLGALSGAAAGALFGGIAGGGEGAGIGAGVGALGGLLGGLIVGKSHEHEVYERRRAAYAARRRARAEALAQINQAVEQYRSQLESEYENQKKALEESTQKQIQELWDNLKRELVEKAQQREQELQSILEGEKGLAWNRGWRRTSREPSRSFFVFAG
ncbi:conserved hypothetical protein [Candidatus Methylacidithermus pantelleriae]|uniref:Glycine zipper domain-containing protein n=1 Tax=Candidatus Methylacidithermus pantelleriae TaxID=2744239 RepID=A0A8J2BM09_9BACT|nr:conserved hypothetical protein [Candidatus Methylacidithermus pantelleriae]